MTLVRYSDWKRPTDGDYAFALAPVTPATPPIGTRTELRALAVELLGPAAAARLEAKVTRWSGPEDERGGARPWVAPQLCFEEVGPRARLTRADLEPVLAGTVAVLRAPSGQVDYLLRDHHGLDVVLYHYRTTGKLPGKLFHADRHSDWCTDSFLEARVPPQAATWWKLLEGLKRPGDGRAVLGDGDVFFATGRPEVSRGGREEPGSLKVPSSLAGQPLDWKSALDRPGALDCDWVSVDLDFLQPFSQLAISAGLLRDARFGALLRSARVRIFVLSPQFTAGGDKVNPWTVRGSLASSVRLLNLMR